MLELLLAGARATRTSRLLGVDEDEVRARARAALTELGGADPDRKVGLTDYLLGQADPIGRADAARHLRQDAEDHALADEDRRASSRDRARRPSCRSCRRRARRRQLPAAAARAGAARPAKRRAVGSPLRRASRRTAAGCYAALGAGAVILVAVVLAVAGVFSGDDEPRGDRDSTAPTTTARDDPAEASARSPTARSSRAVPLEPPGGGDARGRRDRRARDRRPAVPRPRSSQNLEPAPAGRRPTSSGSCSTRTRATRCSPIFPDEQRHVHRPLRDPDAVTGLISPQAPVDRGLASPNARQIARRDPAGRRGSRRSPIQRPGRDRPARATIPRAGGSRRRRQQGG